MANKEQGTVAALTEDDSEKKVEVTEGANTTGESEAKTSEASESTATVPISAEYNASAIDVLEGLEAVRLRPGMYIGTTGPRGLHHLVWEIVDNAVDEALAGHCNRIDITINEDESCTVQDNGRGIPTDIVEKTGKSAVETVFTVLHAGGKFGGGGYKVSGGLHGVGASVVNALSERLEVEVYRLGRVHRQVYLRGDADGLLQVLGETDLQGTKVTFWPDELIFHDINEDNERLKIYFEWDVLATRLREMAFLNKGLCIVLTDNRSTKGAGKSETYHYAGGISSYVEYLNESRDVLHKPPIYFEQRTNDITAECSLQWTTLYSESVYSFVNNINTHDGGTHLTGFRNALTRVVNEYAKKTNILKESDERFTGEDIREGMTAIISVKVPDPQFEGQTKERLGNREVQGVVQGIASERLADWLELNPKPAKDILMKVLQSKQAREAAQKAKQTVRRQSALSGGGLPGKLADCSDKDPEKCEVFLVEGDSAGGSAKQGRDRSFQAILPLRGKILNVERVQPSRIYDNNEVQAMIQALGLVVTELDEDGGKSTGMLRPNALNLDLTKLRYHKVIIMTDADVDGSHIRTLLLTFLFRYARPVVDNGYVYIAQPPLFKVSKGKRVEYCYNEHKLEAVLAEMGDKGVDIQRYKGLGEMMAEQLWETTMNPATRTLKQVTIEDASEADHIFDLLMGESVAPRKEFIEKNSHLVAHLDV
jgi:DNA gyrase subunit B